MRFEREFDLARALGEVLQVLLAEARDPSDALPSGAAVLVALDVVAKRQKLTAKVGLVDLVSEPLRPEDPPRVDRAPFAVRAASDVEDDAVGMKLWVKSAARLVTEARRDYVPRGDDITAAVDPCLGVALELGECLRDGAVVRFEEPAVAAHKCRQTHALVRGNGHVPPRAPLVEALTVRHQDLAIRGIPPRQEPCKVVRLTRPESPSCSAPRPCQREATMPALSRSV
jgi:hypothetical protein